MHDAGIDFSFLARVQASDTNERDDSDMLILPTGPWSSADAPIWGKPYLKNDIWIRHRQRKLTFLFKLCILLSCFLECKEYQGCRALTG